MALKAIALMGPTGAGKSALAMEVAHKAGTSIIACDSMQVYKGLDIGTAKPTQAERARVPHHLIDSAKLTHTFSAAQWGREAEAIIRHENGSGRMPLIVGGTGLYLRALIDGLADIPPEKPEVRQQLQSDLDALGVAAMHARLAEVDETAALRLRPTDAQRIMRALAVFESTGRPLSEWQSQASPQPSFNCPVFVLDMERRKLREALTERFHAMLDAGWLDEVRWLASLDLSAAHPALRAVGYRQLLAHVRGACSLAEAVKAGITATHRYAKRQITWFRHQTQAEWGEAGSLRPRLMKALAA